MRVLTREGPRREQTPEEAGEEVGPARKDRGRDAGGPVTALAVPQGAPELGCPFGIVLTGARMA